MFGFGKKKKLEAYRAVFNEAINSVKVDTERFTNEYSNGDHKQLVTEDDFVRYLSPRFRSLIAAHEAGNNIAFESQHVANLLAGGIEAVRKQIPF